MLDAVLVPISQGTKVRIVTEYDLHTSKLCARFMPVNVLVSVNSLQAESESKNGMTE